MDSDETAEPIEHEVEFFNIMEVGKLYSPLCNDNQCHNYSDFSLSLRRLATLFFVLILPYLSRICPTLNLSTLNTSSTLR